MSEIDSILERYRCADFGTRLYLLLDHRGLRPRFEQIEAAEEARPAEGAVSVPAWWGAVSRPIRRVLRGCCAQGT